MKRQVDELFLISFFYVENTATKTIYYIVKGKTEKITCANTENAIESSEYLTPSWENSCKRWDQTSCILGQVILND